MPEIPQWLAEDGRQKRKKGNGNDDSPPPVVIGSGDALDNQEFPQLDWIVEGLLPTGLGMLAG